MRRRASTRTIWSLITVLALAGCTHHPAAKPTAAPVQVLSPADATSIQTGLLSTNPTDVEAVLAPQVAIQYAKAPKALWPAGSVITIDRTHMRSYGPNLAVVTATVTGPQPGKWQFLLVKTNGHWAVLSTTAVK